MLLLESSRRPSRVCHSRTTRAFASASFWSSGLRVGVGVTVGDGDDDCDGPVGVGLLVGAAVQPPISAAAMMAPTALAASPWWVIPSSFA